MASNYFLMKETESEIFEHLNDYFEHVIQMHKMLFDIMEPEKNVTEEEFDKLNYLEEISNGYYRDILSDSMWSIQKDQPRASNLRFIISVINSAKELERVGDYAIDAVKILKKERIDTNAFELFENIYNNVINGMQNFAEIVRNKRSHKVGIDLKQQFGEYQKYVKTNISKIMHLPVDFENDEGKFKNRVKLIILFNKLERSMEHAYNVVRAFSYVNFQEE